MSSLSTHVLDISLGTPAAGIPVTLTAIEGERPTPLGTSRTDESGRIAALLPEGRSGEYRLTYHLDGHPRGEGLYPLIEIDVVLDPERHHHVVLTLSPYGYFVACVKS